MPKLKHLSGKEVIRFCDSYGFTISRQKGSHVNLVRIVSGKKQLVTIPDHREIDRGTLHSICKQLGYYIPENEIREFFYTGNR
jgi:predicted RNA binding protein YcfA (HicA-like mRNA interferase family)